MPSSRRAEGLVALLLLLAAVFGFAFTVVYIVLSGDTQLLGIAMGGALLLLAAACIVAGKFVVPQETAVEERGPLLDEERTEEVVEMVEAGGEGISRRVMLLGAGGIAGAALVTAAATPLASLGPDDARPARDPVGARGAPGRRGGAAVPGRRDPDRLVLHRAARGQGPGVLRRRAAGGPAAGGVHPPAGGPPRLGRRPGSSPTRRSAPTPAARSRCTATRPTRQPASSRRSPARATTRRSCPATAGEWCSARPAGRCPSCR